MYTIIKNYLEKSGEVEGIKIVPTSLNDHGYLVETEIDYKTICKVSRLMKQWLIIDNMFESIKTYCIESVYDSILENLTKLDLEIASIFEQV